VRGLPLRGAKYGSYLVGKTLSHRAEREWVEKQTWTPETSKVPSV
jgi:hypothetical protein